MVESSNHPLHWAGKVHREGRGGRGEFRGLHLLGCDDCFVVGMHSSDAKGCFNSLGVEGLVEGATKHGEKLLLADSLLVLIFEFRDGGVPFLLELRKANHIKSLECMRAVGGIDQYNNIVQDAELEELQ